MDSNKIKKGLGRGLSSLIGESKTEIQKNQLAISDLVPNKYQPRKIFDESNLDELAKSIAERGMIQPIVVRVSNDNKSKYEIIAGERRWLAAQRAGFNEIPAVILEIDDQKSLEIAIVENVQRQDLNVIEEANGYQRLIKEFGYDHEKIAKFMSKSRSHISNTLRLLTLPQDVISLIKEGLITAGQARPLIGLSDASSIAENIVKKKVSAREVEILSQKKKNNKTKTTSKDPNISFVENEIESKIGLSVKIYNKKNNSGKIVINYKTLDQFELISKLLRD